MGAGEPADIGADPGSEIDVEHHQNRKENEARQSGRKRLDPKSRRPLHPGEDQAVCKEQGGLLFCDQPIPPSSRPFRVWSDSQSHIALLLKTPASISGMYGKRYSPILNECAAPSTRFSEMGVIDYLAMVIPGNEPPRFFSNRLNAIYSKQTDPLCNRLHKSAKNMQDPAKNYIALFQQRLICDIYLTGFDWKLFSIGWPGRRPRAQPGRSASDQTPPLRPWRSRPLRKSPAPGPPRLP